MYGTNSQRQREREVFEGKLYFEGYWQNVHGENGEMGTVKLESFSKEINQHLFIQASWVFTSL